MSTTLPTVPSGQNARPAPVPPRRRHTVLWVIISILAGIGSLIVAITLIGIAASPDHAVNGPTAGTTQPQVTPVTQTPAAVAPQYTASQQQAIASAQGYLNMGGGFSRLGLIKQLSSKYGDAFSHRLAVFAVNHVKVNWFRQAVLSAKGYLQTGGGFSYSSLVQQLSSPYGEHFTLAQAEHAARAVGLRP